MLLLAPPKLNDGVEDAAAGVLDACCWPPKPPNEKPELAGAAATRVRMVKGHTFSIHAPAAAPVAAGVVLVLPKLKPPGLFCAGWPLLFPKLKAA